MDRTQAKLLIDKGFTAEEVKIIFKNFNPVCFDIMRQFAGGVEIEWRGELSDELYFGYSAADYAITPETYTMNGVECPAPYRVEPERGVEYYFAENDRGIKSHIWSGDWLDKNIFKCGKCFKTEEDARATDIAIWGEL